MNEAQKILFETYNGGDFEYLIEEEYPKGLKTEDRLLEFLRCELSEREGCDSLETAAARIAKAIHQLEDVMAALDIAADNK